MTSSRSEVNAALRKELGKERVQVQLTRSQIAALKARSREHGISVSALIRDAVEKSLRDADAATRADLHKRAEAAFRKYRSGLPDLAEGHDKYTWDDDI